MSKNTVLGYMGYCFVNSKLHLKTLSGLSLPNLLTEELKIRGSQQSVENIATPTGIEERLKHFVPLLSIYCHCCGTVLVFLRT